MLEGWYNIIELLTVTKVAMLHSSIRRYFLGRYEQEFLLRHRARWRNHLEKWCNEVKYPSSMSRSHTFPINPIYPMITGFLSNSKSNSESSHTRIMRFGGQGPRSRTSTYQPKSNITGNLQQWLIMSKYEVNTLFILLYKKIPSAAIRLPLTLRDQVTLFLVIVSSFFFLFFHKRNAQDPRV